jgi:hypothetical protein
LVGPTRLHGARSQADSRTGDNRCPLDAEEGNVVSVANKKRTHSAWRRPTSGSELEDTSFTRSRDPCTSIPTELPARKRCEVGRSIRYRGRANLRKQEDPAPGSRSHGRMRGSPPITASRATERVVRDA